MANIGDLILIDADAKENTVDPDSDRSARMANSEDPDSDGQMQRQTLLIPNQIGQIEWQTV